MAYRGKIYAIGGRSGPGDFGDVDVYDPATDAWTPGPSIVPRGTAGAAVYCGAIYVFGGESQAAGKTLDEVLRLDPEPEHLGAITTHALGAQLCPRGRLQELGLSGRRKRDRRHEPRVVGQHARRAVHRVQRRLDADYRWKR